MHHITLLNTENALFMQLKTSRGMQVSGLVWQKLPSSTRLALFLHQCCYDTVQCWTYAALQVPFNIPTKGEMKHPHGSDEFFLTPPIYGLMLLLPYWHILWFILLASGPRCKHHGLIVLLWQGLHSPSILASLCMVTQIMFMYYHHHTLLQT